MMDRDKYLADARGKIAQYGRLIQHVFGTPPEPPFSYTVGNHSKGLPELLLIGVGPRTSQWLLNELSEWMIRNGRAFEEMERPDLGVGIPCVMIEATDEAKREFTILVDDVLDVSPADYRVMQVVVPDTNGRLPWEPDCAKPFRDVKVLRKNALQ